MLIFGGNVDHIGNSACVWDTSNCLVGGVLKLKLNWVTQTLTRLIKNHIRSRLTAGNFFAIVKHLMPTLPLLATL